MTWVEKMTDTPSTNVEEAFEKGQKAYHQKEYRAAMKWFSGAAKLGRAEAQYYVGTMYDYGEGVQIDLPQAQNWYSKAAAQGHEQARLSLKNLYQLIEDYFDDNEEEGLSKELKSTSKEPRRWYIAVPFEENEEAKKLGARWDREERKWYALNAQCELTLRWPLINMTPITELVGEDRNFSGFELRNYLDMPYAKKEEAKHHGARWDPLVKKWYAPKSEKYLLHHWPLKNDLFLRNRLFVDLIPSTCWFTNVRSCVHPTDWDRLRAYVYKRANNRCECCQAVGRIEAHERWRYDNQKKVQKLMRIIALCRDCHETTHMGFATIRGRGDAAKEHLMRVTGLSDEEAKEHIEIAFALWNERSNCDWELDLSLITDNGVKLNNLPEKPARRKIAGVELERVKKPESRKRPHPSPSEEASETEEELTVTKFFRPVKRQRRSVETDFSISPKKGNSSR